MPSGCLNGALKRDAKDPPDGPELGGLRADSSASQCSLSLSHGGRDQEAEAGHPQQLPCRKGEPSPGGRGPG